MMIVGGDGKFISIPDIKETRIKSTYAIIIKKIFLQYGTSDKF